MSRSSGCWRSPREADRARPRRRSGPPGRPARRRPVRRAGAREEHRQRADRARRGGPAPLRGVPEPLGRRLVLRDSARDEGHHPRAPGRRRDDGAGAGLLRGEVRHLDPARPAAPGLQPPGVGRPLRGRRPRAGADLRGAAPLGPRPRRRRGGAGCRPGHARPDPPRDGGGRAVSGLQIALIVTLVLPALAVVLWPRRHGAGTEGPTAPERPSDDRRLEQEEEKVALYRALRELEFDHGAGHLSDADYEGLRERYETAAAALLTGLDTLGPGPAPREPATPAPAPAATASWPRRPAVTAAGALLLLVFGVIIGINASRLTGRDETTTLGGARLPVPGPGASPV